MEIQALAWKQVYPRVFDQILQDGVPEGFIAAKQAVESELSSPEIQEACANIRDYLERIALHEDPLSTEGYYLVFQLAEEACILEGMGFFVDDKARTEVHRALKNALATRVGWFKEDMRTNRRAQLSELWPFPDLLRDYG